MQTFPWLATAVTCVMVQIVAAGLSPAAAGPSAETAKKCVRYSYLLYPYQRPGSVRMSGDRNNYFRDCMAKDGNVPEPPPPKEPGAATDNFEPHFLAGSQVLVLATDY
ncbi:hypothetical protein Q2941_27970 [Bradyrhizobium sp. UFLA05-153]